MAFVVAIDGPAGSGKGTITKLVGEKTNLVNVDTGAMYRCVTLACLNQNIKCDEIEKIEEKVDENTYLFSGNIAIYEIEDILDVDIEDGDYDTISGYLVEKLGRIPTDKDKGTVIETEDVVYKIENVKERRITKIKACKIEKVEQEEKEEDKEEE